MVGLSNFKINSKEDFSAHVLYQSIGNDFSYYDLSRGFDVL